MMMLWVLDHVWDKVLLLMKESNYNTIKIWERLQPVIAKYNIPTVPENHEKWATIVDISAKIGVWAVFERTIWQLKCLKCLWLWKSWIENYCSVRKVSHNAKCHEADSAWWSSSVKNANFLCEISYDDPGCKKNYIITPKDRALSCTNLLKKPQLWHDFCINWLYYYYHKENTYQKITIQCLHNISVGDKKIFHNYGEQ